jgi:predicted AlkP superfamily phosphohydrolase/phosphomutase
MDALWKAEDWNLMEVVVTGTDRLHHFAFDAYADAGHSHHQDFLDYYRHVDDFIGYVYEKFSKTGSRRDNFFILSDHGFCQTRKEVYINTVLARHGFLDLTKPDSHSLESIAEKSKAFALDPARIYIHRAGRYPKGSVADGDAPAVKEELKSVFASLRDGETHVVRKIFDGADVYSGPQAHKGPDLLLVPHNGYDLKGRVGSQTMFGERRLQGMHTWDDAFFATLRKDLMDEITRDDADGGFNLLDIPPMILKSLDVV